MILRRCCFWKKMCHGFSTKATPKSDGTPTRLNLNGQSWPTDDFTNITPRIVEHVGRNLHNLPGHPLCLLKERITDFFYKRFTGHMGNPIFSVHDNLSPIVSVQQNFDSLLVPNDHVSRNKSDCYYVNRDRLLRAHTTAHQVELIKMGLNNFIVFGDVYRRDEIDSTHYPVFHQADAVRLCTVHDLGGLLGMRGEPCLDIFERSLDANGETPYKQNEHTVAATKIMEWELKSALTSLAQTLFGENIPVRWVDVYFPFTHPSWELEVEFNGNWLEVLGCGIMRHNILKNAGVHDRIGWAFGLGLERLAMLMYSIPDIRIFWSKDTGFLNQFKNKTPFEKIVYKQVSVYPQCNNDLSFWLPEDGTFESNDFYELVRDVGGDLVEQVNLIDDFTHPKTGRKSHCYRITYRHIGRTLTQEEVNKVHDAISSKTVERLGVTVR